MMSNSVIVNMLHSTRPSVGMLDISISSSVASALPSSPCGLTILASDRALEAIPHARRLSCTASSSRLYMKIFHINMTIIRQIV
jgi:hypothetical protein